MLFVQWSVFVPWAAGVAVCVYLSFIQLPIRIVVSLAAVDFSPLWEKEKYAISPPDLPLQVKI